MSFVLLSRMKDLNAFCGLHYWLEVVRSMQSDLQAAATQPPSLPFYFPFPAGPQKEKQERKILLPFVMFKRLLSMLMRPYFQV